MGEALHRVFVFGTLKEGFPNFATNKGRRLPGVYATKERLPLFLVGERHTPWLLDQPGEGEFVLGQVFEVDDETLVAMDRLERIREPDGYTRALLAVVPMQPGQAEDVEVFAYLKRPELLVPSEVRRGPLRDYTLEDAALYRPRP